MYNVDIPLAPPHIHILHQYYTDGPLCNFCLKKITVKFGLCTTFRYAEKDQWIQVALPGHLLSANRLPFLPETNTERSERRATELPIFQFYESYSCHQLARSSGLCFAQLCVYSMTCDSHQIHRIKTWQVAMLRIPENIHTDHHWSVYENRIRCTSSCTLAQPHFTYRIPLPKMLKYSQITMPLGARANGW